MSVAVMILSNERGRDYVGIVSESEDAARDAVDRLSSAIDQYEAAQKKYFELEEYYCSRQWRKDFEDDEAGRLPEDLKRGVLSEDAVYDLITEHSDLILRMNRVAVRAMAEDRIRRNEE